MPMMPEEPTPAMIEAVASQLVSFLDCRQHAARRWAEILYDRFVEASRPPAAKKQSIDPRYDWPVTHIQAWLCEAMRTIEAADLPRNSFPAGFQSCMPPVVRSYAEAYSSEAPRLRRPKPTASQIDRMEHCVQWLLWLTDDARMLVARKCQGTPWPRLAQIDKRSERTLRNHFAMAIEAIGARLTATQPRLGCFLNDPE